MSYTFLFTGECDPVVSIETCCSPGESIVGGGGGGGSAGSPLNRENKENMLIQKSLSEKIQGIWKCCQNTGNFVNSSVF